MGKIVAIILILAAIYFVYSNKINAGIDKAKDASINAVQNETTFKKVNKSINSNLDTNENIMK